MSRFDEKFQELWQEVGNMLLEPERESALIELVPTAAAAEDETVDEDFFLEFASNSASSGVKRYDANHLSSDKARNYQMLALCAQAIVSHDRVESARRMAIAIINAL